MTRLNIIGIGIIGLMLGSLGSVILSRLSEEFRWSTIKGFLVGRSQCPHCHHTLNAKELIPIISYLLQRGRCTFCHEKISIRYPLLEICSAGIAMASYIFIYHVMAYAIPDNEKILYLIIRGITNRFLLLMMLHDIKTQELHFPLRIATIIRGVFREWRLLSPSEYSWARAGAGIFGVTFWGIYEFGKWYVKKRFHTTGLGFGDGDIYIGLLIGMFFPLLSEINGRELGIYSCIYYLIAIILISCIIGLIQGGIEGILHKKLPQKIAFIPALIISFRVLMVWGDYIFYWLRK